MIALIYTTSRLFHSLTLTYTPFFINETNITNSGILAMAPFFNFMAALVSSFGVNLLLKKLYNNKVRFMNAVEAFLFSLIQIFRIVILVFSDNIHYWNSLLVVQLSVHI